MSRSLNITIWHCLILSSLLFSPLFTAAQDRAAHMEQQVHELVNEYRKQKGMAPLEYLDEAADVAYTHTEPMAAGKKRFGHDGFEERYKMLKKPYPEIHAFAENVAYGDMDAAEAVKMWLKSSGHRKNIEGNFTHTGVAIARGRNGAYYFTQLFIKK